MRRVAFKYTEYKVDSRDSFSEIYRQTSNISGRQINQVFKAIWEEILEETRTNPEGFELGSNLGVLQLIGIKLTKVSKERYSNVIRAKKYKLLRTDNYVYGLYWFRSNSAFRNVQYWISETGKKLKLKLTQWVKEDKKFNVIKINNRQELGKLKIATNQINQMNKGKYNES